ncbi:MAG TPA: hypothetical protein VMM13_17460 [Euzebya sp.]|nr:hypothetical protein [Euzebya sp.]
MPRLILRGPEDAELLQRLDLQRADWSAPGWRRRVRGRGFSYHDEEGRLLSETDRARCAALVLPPAWTDVWISSDPDGHLQATGVDAADRRQYRYDDRWVEGRRLQNLDRLGEIGQRLGPLRRRLDEVLVDDASPCDRPPRRCCDWSTAVDTTAEALGNTRAVARGSYIHPVVLEEDPSAVQEAWRGARASSRYDRRERALLRLLEETPSLLDSWIASGDARRQAEARG